MLLFLVGWVGNSGANIVDFLCVDIFILLCMTERMRKTRKPTVHQDHDQVAADP